jgi:uncharacterized protein
LFKGFFPESLSICCQQSLGRETLDKLVRQIEVRSVLQSESHTPLLRPFWVGVAPNPWILLLILGTIVVVWRGFLMLGPARGTGPGMALHFLFLAATPLLFLVREGRRKIGLTVRVSAGWATAALFGGVLAATSIGVLGTLLYGSSPANWFVTVRQTMLSASRLRGLPPLELFAALAVPAALFSPVGEELFFRGVFHESLAVRAGHIVASVITGVVFGVMHALHHGVSAGPAGIEIQGVSALAWVVLTCLLSLLFTFFRVRSKSIWSAVLCHAAFNVTMVAFIVTVLA